MSNALAIASVTRVLKDLLNDGFVNHDVSGAIGGNVTVTALPPDRISTDVDAAQTSQINLFLHQVTPNSGWRNRDLPTRNTEGQRLGNPLLSLNLHYLVTAYGAEELHSEILLGYAMLLLHENTVLTREAIRSSLAGVAVDQESLPPALRAVAGSELAEQQELIRITPANLSTEEMSKLWSAFQARYRPTAAYEVSVVLMESKRPRRAPLPVLTRGRRDPDTGREEGITASPTLLPPYPTLTALTFADEMNVVRMGEVVTLEGHYLASDEIVVCFTDPRTRRAFSLKAVAGGTPLRRTVQLPSDPATGPVAADAPENPENWRPGPYDVTIVLKPPGEDAARTSNALAMMLAPRIVSVAYAAASKQINVECSPPVGKNQRVSLIVGQREVPAESITTASTRQLTFSTAGIVPGTYWVRLRVDGAESILIDRSARPPAFVATQKVVVT
ncbi:hypothetical protein ACVWYQ_006393 [Bradyrhizobium sp. USDA 3397]